MAGSLWLQVVAVASHVERGLDVLLVLESSEKIAQTGEKEKKSHSNQRRGLYGQTQPLDSAHQQVETTARPIVVKIVDESGEGVGQGTNTEQERHLDKQNNQALHNTDDGKDHHQVEVEDVGNS